ncbi:ATP-dependent RNA helicase SUV3, mitochondrial [Candida viswanathii]|uniref:ATP-dependent RNA helicase SUV3, mitochondrial n=1 Tax=Candida viswanathii TaxID=5486 RepID=A0A367XN98_9ASCO|nr:ATP-dependent RNA helicase SUV3, mitochondrial [Candida viswanathii]
MYQRLIYRSLRGNATRSLVSRYAANRAASAQLLRCFSKQLLASQSPSETPADSIPKNKEPRETHIKDSEVHPQKYQTECYDHFGQSIPRYCDEVGKLLHDSVVPEPYGILNAQPTEVKDDLRKQFHKTLLRMSKDDKIERDFLHVTLTIEDFINPTYPKAMQILYAIEHDTVAKGLLELYDLKDKSELVQRVLSHLMYQEFVNYKLKTGRSQGPEIDLSMPAAWFPEARKMKRKIVMHVGPTNSGKTYHSLVKLSKSKTGYYAGPLRLLAREVYEKFQKQGIGCNLITGEEIVPSIDQHGKISGLASGTIEMIPLHKKLDLCVIDEIQMVADPRRGSVWTNAVLGVMAHEIHLCGEASAVPLIKKIVEVTGDELEVKNFKRLGKLTVENRAIRIGELRKGDCLVAFSKRKIMRMKCDIEQQSNLTVGVVYGALPPEIRSQEATKFNNGEYDVLVASDAIGMGLNLKINRIVFSGISKFDGTAMSNLTVLEVRQIAGRAGRYSHENGGATEGFVTALQRQSLAYINECMNRPVEPLPRACIWPTHEIWRDYMASIDRPGAQLSDVLRLYFETTFTTSEGVYFVSEWDTKIALLDMISRDSHLRKMSFDDQLTLCEAPVNMVTSLGSKKICDTMHEYLRTVVDRSCKSIFDYDFLDFDLISQRPLLTFNAATTVENIDHFEQMHKLLLVFMWLSQRYPTLFVDKESAFEMKALVEKRLSEELTNIRRLNKLEGYKAFGGRR